jgi:hypothetical protein
MEREVSMRGIVRALTALLLFVLVPGIAHAQASLAGVVKDSSGAVLPGVTVEASSPVLIEKVRSTSTDSAGRYTIPDLRPGDYKVTFTLSGFSTVVRDQVELRGSAVVDINADMRVGVQETVNVTGETPVVNLQTTTRQAVMDQEIVSAIPTSRTPFTTGVLIPGVSRGAFMSQDVGGSVVQEVASLEANGGRTADQRMMVNGVALSSMIQGGWGGGAVPNATGTQEFAIDVSAVDAQAATGGVRINFIPRDGGNRYSGTIFASLATDDFVSDNYTGSDVEDRGLTAPNTIKGNGDFNPGFGGPLVRDKLWFFVSARYLFAENYVAGLFHNENANRLDRFDYVRSSRQAILHQDQQIIQGRFTWQANDRNKFGVTADWENFCACTTGLSATVSPEAGNDRRFPLQRFVSLDWNSPVSNRLLLEASAIHRVERWGGMHPQVGKAGNISSLTPGMTSVTDTANPVTGGSLTYRAAAQYNNSWNWNIHYRAAASYITGSHVFKVGFNNAYGHYEETIYADPATPYTFSFANMVPQSMTYRIVPRQVAVNVNRDLGFFAQDRWTVGRWTLSGGIRFDQFVNSFPAQSVGATPLAPNLNVSFPETDNLNWKDITPKLGAAYDLFGNGRTALKVTLNKYLAGLGTTGPVSDLPNPINRLTTQDSRVWNDFTHGPLGSDPRSGNFVPDCDLLNYGPNGECAGLGVGGVTTFGTLTPGTTFDPDMLVGWGKRDYNWEFTTSVQHEVIPRMSLEVQYARRWYGNFRVQDDQSVTAGNYDPFTIVVPADPNLPDGGGYTLTGYDLRPGPAAPSQFVTLADAYGKQTEHFDGVNITVISRLQNGLLIQGGLGAGRVVTNDCDIVDDLPETLHQFFGANTRQFFFAARPLERCEQNNGLRTRLQGLAAYTIPKVDVQIAGTYQNLPGAAVSANANIVAACSPTVTALCSSDLGRGFTGAPFGRQFNIVEAGQLYVERLNQLDLRFSKLFRFTATRTSINFDLYNVLNDNSVLGEQSSYNPANQHWREVTSILLPRLFKISAQLDF